MSPQTREKAMFIDGNSLVYRAFFALPPLQNSSGEHTNAVYGFTTMLLKILEEEKPAYVAVAFDPPAPTFRHRMYGEYKSGRQETPAELGEQMQRVKEILRAMRIPLFEVEDFEADDLIATLTTLAAERSLHSLVVTGDADLLQLVGPEVKVLLTRKGITQMDCYDEERLRERYGLEPSRMVEYKALVGDVSDNIPGVPGVGDKTARRLLQEYGSLEKILEAAGELPAKLGGSLQENRDKVLLGKELVTLKRHVPLEVSWEQCRLGRPDRDRLLEIFRDLEFKSLAARIGQLFPGEERSATVQKSDYQVAPIDTIEKLQEVLGGISAGDKLALVVEFAPGRLCWRQPPALAALAVNEEKGYYLSPGLLGGTKPAAWETLVAAWHRGANLIGHDIKLVYQHFFCHGLAEPPFVFDTQLAAYLLEPTRSSYELPRLLNDYLSLSLEIPESGGRQKNGRSAAERGMDLAECTRHLFSLEERFHLLLRERALENLYFDLEHPLAGVLARMERHGMAVDVQMLKEIARDIRSRTAVLAKEIRELAGEDFNLNSSRQLAHILFEKLKLPAGRKTKTGYSTDAAVLEELAPHHEIVAKLLLYRQLIKLESTYLSGLIDLVDPETGKIYSSFNQTVTATGRLSSSEPNLQNIPVRLEEGRRIRRAFVTSAAHRVLLAADYSQIELRILAHLSQDPILLESFLLEQDVHRRTAAEVFHVQPEEVTPLMRDKAKAVNFGIIYGMSDYGLARSIGVSRQEARQYIDSYFERYRGVKRYIEEIVAQARELGFVTTLLNRRRYLPELRSSHFGRRGFAERIARNTPVQGSAADIIKLAMLRIDRIILEGGFNAAMLLQVHDELLFEVEEAQADFFAAVVKREMEQAFTLSVPLTVEIRLGKNWAELKKL